MSRPEFVHLHNHSDYSLLDGATRVGAMAQRAAELGMPAMALTDHGNLFGAIEFYQACRSADIKPVLGLGAYCAANSRVEPSGTDNPTYQLTLLAKNNEGWNTVFRSSIL